jgi:hypothetical protein
MGVDGHKPLDGVLFMVRVILVKRLKVCCCRCHLYLLSSHVSTLAYRISTFYYVAGRGDG